MILFENTAKKNKAVDQTVFPHAKIFLISVYCLSFFNSFNVIQAKSSRFFLF